MMIYSEIHSLFYRALNKWNKTKKRKEWKKVPHVGQNTYFEPGNQLFEPQLVGASTISPDCINASTIKNVLDIYNKLTADKYLEFVKNYYKEGLKNFGDKWVYADINTVLYGVCKNIKIESYLEIGVRRGRSMAMVASLSPNCKIAGFDLWIQNYAGADNPGKDFVRNEMSKLGFKGSLEFFDGDSKKTVPHFFESNPETYFDLITVDGDHSWGGAVTDIKNVLPRLKVGGVLVFDDICSYEHPYLQKVWTKMVANNPQFSTFTYNEMGLGVGFAIKRY